MQLYPGWSARDNYAVHGKKKKKKKDKNLGDNSGNVRIEMRISVFVCLVGWLFFFFCPDWSLICWNLGLVALSSPVSISLIADRRKCCAQGMMRPLRVNVALFDWWLFTLSCPIILSAWHF